MITQCPQPAREGFGTVPPKFYQSVDVLEVDVALLGGSSRRLLAWRTMGVFRGEVTVEVHAGAHSGTFFAMVLVKSWISVSMLDVRLLLDTV